MKMILKLLRFLADDDGLTSVEYAFMMFLLVLALLTGTTWLGQASAHRLDAPLR